MGPFVLRIKPGRQTDLLADASDNPQVIKSFIHILVHRGQSKLLISSRILSPIFLATSSAHAEYRSKRARPSHQEALLALAGQVGVLRPSDLAALGIPRDYLRRLVKEGQLKRVERGLYMLVDAQITEQHALVEAARRVPHGVVCLFSALAFHHLTSHPPQEVWLAIDRDAHAPHTTRLPLHMVRFSGLAYTFGVETHQIEGVPIRIYSPAKTVADCFKYRYKLGLEVALEGLRETWYTRKATLSELWEAARVCRVTSSMRPYLDVFGT